MKIRVDLSNLNAAMDRVSAVKPVNTDGLSAFMFTILDGRCYVHSQDATNYGYARAEVPLISSSGVEVGSSFVYPADRTEAFKHLDGWIDIESITEGDAHRIKYVTEEGAEADRQTFDPRIFTSFEDKLLEAGTEYTYPTILLREGLGLTSPSLAEKEDPDQPFKTVQLFDDSSADTSKGHGTFYASDGMRSCYFFSEALKGKGLAVHERYIPQLLSFLNKCGDTVKVKTGRSTTFILDQVAGKDGVVSDGAVFGWTAQAKGHPRYKYYALKHDKFLLRVDKRQALKTLKHVASELKSSNRPKVRLVYSNQSLRVLASVNKETINSVPITVIPQDLEDGTPSMTEFQANANVNHLISLFESSRLHQVNFRVAVVENTTLFRTIDQFMLGSTGKVYVSKEAAPDKETCHECWVTHFATSMD